MNRRIWWRRTSGGILILCLRIWVGMRYSLHVEMQSSSSFSNVFIIVICGCMFIYPFFLSAWERKRNEVFWKCDSESTPFTIVPFSVCFKPSAWALRFDWICVFYYGHFSIFIYFMAYQDLEDLQYTLEYECSDYKKSLAWFDWNVGIPAWLPIDWAFSRCLSSLSPKNPRSSRPFCLM